MDIALIISIVGSTFAIIGTNIALIGWLRGDMKAIENEMKDFHGRLCTLEERYLQIITKKD